MGPSMCPVSPKPKWRKNDDDHDELRAVAHDIREALVKQKGFVGGVLFAFKEVTYAQGRHTADITLEEVKTYDVLPAEYFGSAGVAEVAGLQNVMLHVGYEGYKHHFSMTRGHVAGQVIEALQQHPGFEVTDLRKAV